MKKIFESVTVKIISVLVGFGLIFGGVTVGLSNAQPTPNFNSAVTARSAMYWQCYSGYHSVGTHSWSYAAYLSSQGWYCYSTGYWG